MFLQNVNSQLQLSSDSDDSDEDLGSLSDTNLENILRGSLVI